MLVGGDGCIEDLFTGGQLAESVIDTPRNILQHRARVVLLAVDSQVGLDLDLQTVPAEIAPSFT